MKRVKLTIAYDGTNYCGWQIQPNGITIEAVINKYLSELLKEDIKVIGASRTDSGVHALGNVAVFDTKTCIPGDKIAFALNQRLPDDIVIRGSEETAPDFHPRYNKNCKVYEYKILNNAFNIPTMRNYSYFYYMKLDIELMKEAAQYIVGEHNFKSFCTPRSNTLGYVRKVKSIDIEKNKEIISIKISGNGFLYNMIRIIVGTLIKVGGGVYPPYYVKDIIEAQNRQKAGPTAPACGLTLISISYNDADKNEIDLSTKPI